MSQDNPFKRQTLKRLTIQKRHWGFPSQKSEKEFIVKQFTKMIKEIRNELRTWSSAPAYPSKTYKKYYYEYWGLRDQLEALQRAVELLK